MMMTTMMRELRVLATITLVLGCCFLESGNCAGPLTFASVCSRVGKYQKLFTGRCDLVIDKFDKSIVEHIDFVKGSDPNITVDEFLRTVYFNSSVEHFRDAHPDHLEKLAGSLPRPTRHPLFCLRR